MLNKTHIAALSIVVVFCAAQPVGASLTLTLGLGNPGISGYVGPYGTVDVTRTSNTTADIVFTGLDSNNGAGPEHFLFGGNGAVYLNVNQVGATSYSGLSATGPGGTQGPYSLPVAGNQDGWGSFNFGINSFDGFNRAASTLSFTITSVGAGWLSDSDVLTPNAGGYFAGAHIFVADANYTSALTTGYSADGVMIPEATSLIVWSLLLGITGLARTRHRQID